MTEKRLSFYDLMDILDNFCIEHEVHQDLDFRELTVHSNKISDVECLFFKNKAGKVVETIVVNKVRSNDRK